MKNCLLIAGVTGAPFLARVVFKGDGYGAWDEGQWALHHKKEEPLIEFFDTRYQFTPYGQFVSRYYVSTLLENDDSRRTPGLNLYGGEPDWSIDGKAMNKVRDWLAQLFDKEALSNSYVVTVRRHGDDTDSIYIVEAPLEVDAWRIAREELADERGCPVEEVINGESMRLSSTYGRNSEFALTSDFARVVRWAPDPESDTGPAARESLGG